MKRLLIIALVTASVTSPVTSTAAEACGVLADPVADVTLRWMPWAGAVDDGGRAVDITQVAFTANERDLVVQLEVRDLSGWGLSRDAEHVVSWRAGERTVSATAMKRGPAWLFLWSDSMDAAGDAVGAIDIARNTISIAVPRVIAGATPGATLDRIEAESTEIVAGWVPGHADQAPNLAGGPQRFIVDAPCEDAAAGAGQSCDVLMAEAAENDGDGPGSLDLRGVSFTAADRALLLQIRVADLDDRPADGGERWDVSWFNPRVYDRRAEQTAFAERSGERIEFGFSRGSTDATTTGALDPASDTITIEVPRAFLRLASGTRLRDVEARAAAMNEGVRTSSERLPASGEKGSWVVDTTCGAIERQACPIVLDRARDARYAEATDEVPENYAGLDLRAVGARPADDQVVMQARVLDLDATDPPGADMVGWTISWLDGERRIYAQAERSNEGTVFRLGSRAASGDAPAGPAFGGRATTGRIDRVNDVVEIDVPRAVLPEDGTPLEGFGATAWALSGRNSGSVYLVWDETAPRTYLAGATCTL